MYKTKFGTVEIIATVFGVFCISCIGHVVLHESNHMAIFVLNNLEIVLLALMAAVFGPYAGLIIGVAGTMFSEYFLPQDYWLITAIAAGMYGTIIGLYSEKLHIINGKFRFNEVILLEALTLFDNILVFTFFIPLLNFFLIKGEIYAEMRTGVKNAFHISLFTLILMPPICFIINWLCSELKKRKKASE